MDVVMLGMLKAGVVSRHTLSPGWGGRGTVGLVDFKRARSWSAKCQSVPPTVTTRISKRHVVCC